MEFFCHWSLHASVQEDMEDMVDAIEKLDAKYDEAKYDTRYKSVGWRHSLAQVAVRKTFMTGQASSTS